jgi:hypothetical protein
VSRVYFHSPSGDAELHGSERAYLGGLCTDIAIGVLDLDNSFRAERALNGILAPDLAPIPNGADYQQWRRDLETRLAIGSMFRGAPFQWRGRPIQSFALMMNTALAVGNNAVRLAARLHGQCEIHTWVDGPNRAWLADVMQTGLDHGIFRSGFWFEDGPGGPRRWSDQGWESVITLLRARDDEPVVTSYSVTESFPHSSIGDWMPAWPEGVLRDWDALSEDDKQARSDRQEQWYDLDDPEQWRISMAGLREDSGGLELKPDGWDSFVFRHGLSVLDLFAHDRDERLDAVTDWSG